MTLPGFPTDNLYKFFAISGLIVILLSVYHYEENYYALEAQGADFKFKIDSLNFEKEFFAGTKQQLLSIKSELAVIRERLLNSKSDTERSTLNRRLNDLKIYSEKVGDSLRSRGIPLIKERYEQELEIIRRTRIKHTLYLCVFGGTFGLVLTCAGFFLWYFRVQRHSDTKEKYEALKIKQSSHHL